MENEVNNESEAPQIKVERVSVTLKELQAMIAKRQKSRLSAHRNRPRAPQCEAKIKDLFFDCRGVEYARLTNGQLIRITPKK